MHPTNGYYQRSHDYLAGLRHQAQRHALARATHEAPRARAVLGPRNHPSAAAHQWHVPVRHQAQPRGHFGSLAR
jgi:hypothetical protein